MGEKPKKIRVTSKKQDRLNPDEIAAKLGATIVGHVSPALGPIERLGMSSVQRSAIIDSDEDNSGPINHPSHYNSGEYEVIDVICDAGFGEGFCLGNALKYILRAKHKEDYEQDLKKAVWYLDYWIDNRDRWE